MSVCFSLQSKKCTIHCRHRMHFTCIVWMGTRKMNEKRTKNTLPIPYGCVDFVVNVCKNKGDGVQTQIDKLRRN